VQVDSGMMVSDSHVTHSSQRATDGGVAADAARGGGRAVPAHTTAPLRPSVVPIDDGNT